MTLPEISVKRHVLAWMLSGVLVLFGIIAYHKMGIDRFPHIELPVISITTTMKGASPEVIDASITNIIESQANSIPGIEHIQSYSSPSVSSVVLTFNLSKDIDVAFNEIQAKISRVINQLPTSANAPMVSKVETNSSPIMWLALQGDRTLQQLNLYAANTLKKKFETLDGVGKVVVGGRRDRTIRVHLYPEKMAALGVSSQELLSAFSREHVQYPGGFLVGDQTEKLLKLDMEFHHSAELENMVVSYRNDAPIRLKDIATVEDGLQDYRQLARFNGKPAVALGIVKIANTNTVDIIHAVKQKINKEILPNLPPGMTLSVASNEATLIKSLVKSLSEHLVEGTLLAALVVLVFLRSFKSTLIVATAIPVSLLGAIAIMYFMGFTFNSMTLLALLLLIGVVVDDAIVVLENIYRHREKNESDPAVAAIKGSKEVFFAVLAATLSLVCIFAPVIFLGGIIGKFFESFAVVVTVGVLVSLFVSLTLTPMLCSRYLSLPTKSNKMSLALEQFFERLDRFYATVLRFALTYRWRVLLVTLLIVLSSTYFFSSVSKEFVPEEDESRFLVSFKTPLGSSIEYTSGRLSRVEGIMAKHPEISTYFSAVGLGQTGQVNQGMAFVRMVPKSERRLTQQALLKALRKEFNEIPGIKAFAGPVPVIGGQRGEPIQFSLTGPNLQETAQLSQRLLNKLTQFPELGKPDLELQVDLPQLNVQIDRTRAANLGISPADIALAINLLSGGMNVAKFNDAKGDGNRYDIRVKAHPSRLNSSKALANIYLKTASNELVRLDTVAHTDTVLGPAVISKLDLQYAADFYATPTMPLAEAIEKINLIANDLLPNGYQIRFKGEAEELAKTAQYMLLTFALALVLLYMVLASQFNSFLQPLIIMVAQPLAVVGGVFALWVTGHSLNIFSMIGLVLLIGLVAKNSILLVDLTNQYRTQGKDIHTALIQACPVRLRPVLMTSLTVVLALAPAAFGFGEGAQTNAPLAIAVIGGMISSTLLTLVVVPAVYSLVEGRRPKAFRHALLTVWERRSTYASFSETALVNSRGKLRDIKNRLFDLKSLLRRRG